MGQQIVGPNSGGSATNTLVINSDGSINTVASAGASVTILRAEINTATSGDNTIIAAVTGKKIKIRHITMMNVAASSTTVIMKSGTATINGTGFVLASNSGYAFDAAGALGAGELAMGTGEAFILNLSAANQLNGFVLYYTE